MSESLKAARENFEIAKNDFLAEKYKRKTDMLAKYDAINDDNKHQRRKVKVEIEGEGKVMSRQGRMKAVTMGRDLERNYTHAKAHMRQFRLNVVGSVGPKLAMMTDSQEFNNETNFWFNSIYSKNCDGRDDTPLPEIVAGVLTAYKREGDILSAFDDYDRDDGKLYFWEADQLVDLSKKDWKAQKQFNPEKYSIEDGVIIDKMGRVEGWCVSSKRGRSTVKLDQAVILTKKVAKLVKSIWRLNQRRGTADILTPATLYEDSYEILNKELQSAKLACGIAGKVKKRDAAESALLDNGIDPEDIIGATNSDVQTGEAAKNYERFEALTGGYLEYLDDDDDFEILDFNRPSIQLAAFLESTVTASGASQGLGKTYSTLTPAGSYTAFRGDMLLTWAQFYWDQKCLERRFMDWLGDKAIGWAIKKGDIKAKAPENWQFKKKYVWPMMPQVDPLKWENAISKALENKTTDYSKLLGPNWRDELANMAEQLKYIRSVFGDENESLSKEVEQ